MVKALVIIALISGVTFGIIVAVILIGLKAKLDGYSEDYKREILRQRRKNGKKKIL